MTLDLWNHCTEVLPLGSDRDEWLRYRQLGIGGSDCSAVMGFRGDYDSPYTVWEHKTGRAADDNLDDNENILWGNLLEPVIRAEASRRLGIQVGQLGTLRSTARPWQQYNPDGVFADGGLLECKNTSAWMSRDWDGEQVPDHAECQVQHGMAVTGATHAWVAGLVGGNRLKLVRIERDDDLIDLINEREQELWGHVMADTPPPMDASTATRDALIRRFGTDTRAVEVDLDTAARINADWHAGHAEEKSGKARKKKAENEARLLMEGATSLTADGVEFARIKGGTFASKRFTDGEPESAPLFKKKVEVVDLDALKAEAPELYRKYQAQVFEATKKGK